MLRKIAFAMAAATTAAPAAAQDMPRYDVPAYCKQVADVGGGSSMIYNGCIEMEQEAYDGLKASWSGITPRARSYCDEVARVGGGSYSILEGCINMEADAAASTPEFKF